MVNEGVKQAVATSLTLLVCAAGRGLDFATTWVAVERGTAVEAKPLTADIFQLLGHRAGMIGYEAFITTPLIFLGCFFARRVFCTTGLAAANAGRLFFFLIGVISLTVAVHNIRYLL
jgi:hypothetical protein